MSALEERLRDLIGDDVSQAPLVGRMPDDVRSRVRRRQVGTAAAGALAVLAIAVMSFVVLNTVELPRRDVPVGESETPTPVGAPTNGAVAFSAVDLDAGLTERIPSRKDPRDLYVTPLGGIPQQVVSHVSDTVDESCPAYSPDGTKLAYLETVAGVEFAIFVADVRTDGVPSEVPVPILHDLRDISGCPLWSPDGSQLAVARGQHGLVIARLDGGSRAVSTGSTASHSSIGAFAWGPDGSVLAAVDSGSIWLVPADGNEPRRVWTSGVERQLSTVAWSPDGTRLAIGGRIGPANRCCEESKPFVEIVDLAPEASAGVEVEGFPQEDDVSELTWSASTNRLIAQLQTSAWSIDPAGASGPTEIDLAFAAASSIVVSPDQRSLLYVAYDGTSYAVVADPAGDRSVPSLFSPWTSGLYTNFGDLSWQPVHR